MKHLLTPSLHETFRWYRKIEDKSKQEVLDNLSKKEFKKTPAMIAGIEFEDDVQDYSEGYDDSNDPPLEEPYAACVREVAALTKGGLWQERAYRDVIIRGKPFLLYGKADVIKRDWIYDIKFTSNYEVGKYTGSIQHLTYMYCTGLEKFAYLISDGRSVWREDYFWDDHCADRLYDELNKLVGFVMADEEFKTAYQQNWKCKY